MWHDIETTDDLLNFKINAEVAAQIIRDSAEQPISIGVSGNWGTGKSSLVKMIGKSLRQDEDSKSKFVFVEFNAWLYQGYEDARLALLQSVSDKLIEVAKDNVTALDKAYGISDKILYVVFNAFCDIFLPLPEIDTFIIDKRLF